MTAGQKNFTKSNVVITGGGSGVGLETARLFVGMGANVTIMGRSEDKLKTALSELNSPKAHLFVGDVTLSKSCTDVIEFASKSAGKPVDVLVNNAGVILRKTAEDTNDDEWLRVIDINVTGLFYMSRAAALQMPDGGNIVNLSSTCGAFGAAGLTAYCASKGAVDQITRTMALELAPRKITVNAVAPGAINSPMLFSEHASDDMKNSAIARNQNSIPIGDVAQPEEIARAVVYLASERHITGSILRIDGGYTAQ